MLRFLAALIFMLFAGLGQAWTDATQLPQAVNGSLDVAELLYAITNAVD